MEENEFFTHLQSELHLRRSLFSSEHVETPLQIVVYII